MDRVGFIGLGNMGRPMASNIRRKQFPLADDFTFLNNGTIGVSPYQVIDAMHQKTMAVNTRAIYGGGDQEAMTAGTSSAAASRRVTASAPIS